MAKTGPIQVLLDISMVLVCGEIRTAPGQSEKNSFSKAQFQSLKNNKQYPHELEGDTTQVINLGSESVGFAHATLHHASRGDRLPRELLLLTSQVPPSKIQVWVGNN